MASSLSTDELENTLETLSQAIDFAAQVKDNQDQFKIARDACIQRFEYSIELSWKVCMKKLGSQTKFAKPTVREMARADLIDSVETWLDFIEARNNSSHAYDEDVAKKVFEEILKFRGESGKLLEGLKKLP